MERYLLEGIGLAFSVVRRGLGRSSYYVLSSDIERIFENVKGST